VFNDNNTAQTRTDTFFILVVSRTARLFYAIVFTI